MELRPGAETQMEVTTTILPRRDIGDIGIAPLTSMYLKGPLRASVSDDFRPRVHDSDVLFVENGAGEKLWRPISNPARVQTSAFLDDGPVGFGLYQTARAFEDYQDTEARYHHRPNAMVRPLGHWGRGAVMLVEIPTGDEFMDNVVAFWRPEEPLAGGSEHRFDYRLTWTLAPPDTGGARIVQSRSGREHDRPGTRRYVIDFDSVAEGLSADVAALGAGEVSGLSVFPLPEGRGTRVTFLFAPGDADAEDLRLTLRGAPAPVWLHRWTRARDGGV
jgi:glucans biosynthesis protein